MKKLLLLLLLYPFVAIAHPGIAIVKDSKGNIYYSDLFKVYKITNGKTTVILSDVHTHELWLDVNDNLIGEDLHYDPVTEKFSHMLWRMSPSGKLDTIIDRKQAYETQDYSIARDKQGNEYYIRSFPPISDTTHIYKRTTDGKETVLATGNFKGVTWLHPQSDESVLYVAQNNVYRLTADGIIHLLAKEIGKRKADNGVTVWGVWEDIQKNVYVAVLSDHVVKKITPSGEISDHYKSEGKWMPNHGVFDSAGNLWLLEINDKNEIRAIEAKPDRSKVKRNSYTAIISAITIIIIAVATRKRRQQKGQGGNT